ncbi:MAG TPA: IS110 family transposase [Mucilaginibacter sp.]|jgi:transposase|nr:IS110 family transposase [Mucilaginibacter sp.]
MQNQTIVGIDVSSATLDICVSDRSGQRSFIINNDIKAISTFFMGYHEVLVIGMENTGRYNWALYEVLKDLPHRVFVVSPLHLKKCMGLIRGKNDKIDAVRIAAFFMKNHAELPQWKPSSSSVQKLKILLTERNARVKAKSILLKQQKDHARMKHLGLDKYLQDLNKQQLVVLNRQIRQIESDMQALIKADEQMHSQAKLICSIPGVGKVLCWTMIAKTENFTTIIEPRKMACYSGVVPFSNSSGTSIRGKERVSNYADKAVKTILHMAAMRAVRLKNDLQVFYLRKVSEGKNKMSVLNAVRNKLIHRIFAVVKNQNPYQNNLLLS